MKRFFILLLHIITMALLLSCGSAPSDTKNITDTTAPDLSVTEAPQATDKTDSTDEKHVVAVVMGRERLPNVSGKYNTWQNNGKDIAHNPDKTKENGLRDIASVYYPSIGLYDVTDPHYQEYMMQLCKMSYVDVINYYFSSVTDIEAGTWFGDSFRGTTLPLLEKYGIKTTARLENPDRAIPESGDTSAVKKAFSDIINLLGDSVLEIDGRPVLSQFKVPGLTQEDILTWKSEHAEKYGVTPFFMLTESSGALKSWNNAVDGFFGWSEQSDVNSLPLQYVDNLGDYRRYITADDAKINHDHHINRIKSLLENKSISYYSEGLNPGFDDIAVWGWGTGPRKVERGNDCELYVYKWESAVRNDFPMVNIVTWDDWGESTTIEPTLEYGVDFLEVTRKYAAEYKGIEANTASLELPGWIYKIRKTTDDSTILSKTDEASDLIAEGRFEEAEAIIRPYVTSLNIPVTSKEFFNYPTTPTTPMGALSDSPIPQKGENGEDIFVPVADTYIRKSDGKAHDTGTETLIKVKQADSTKLTRHAYIKFDTAKTQLNGVTKATLRLYCNFASDKNAEIASRNIKLYEANTDWTEESFSWATKPEIGDIILNIESSDFKSKSWIEIDVTDYVKAHLGEKLAFAIINEGIDTENNQLEFHSREAAENHPQLVIE